MKGKRVFLLLALCLLSIAQIARTDPPNASTVPAATDAKAPSETKVLRGLREEAAMRPPSTQPTVLRQYDINDFASWDEPARNEKALQDLVSKIADLAELKPEAISRSRLRPLLLVNTSLEGHALIITYLEGRRDQAEWESRIRVEDMLRKRQIEPGL